MALRRAKELKITNRQTPAFRVEESIGHLDLDGCHNIVCPTSPPLGNRSNII
jgi:hypothetical protein